MKQTSIHLHVVPLAGALLALSGNYSWAQPGLTPFEATETICSATPGKLWVTEDGKTLHVRGQVNSTTVQSSEPRMKGTNTAVLSLDLNLTTGRGTAYATFMIVPEGVNGTWQGTGVFQLKDGKLTGISVGQGTGDLAGQQIRLELEEVAAVDPPCTPVGPGGNVQSKIKGVIFNPKGK